MEAQERPQCAVRGVVLRLLTEAKTLWKAARYRILTAPGVAHDISRAVISSLCQQKAQCDVLVSLPGVMEVLIPGQDHGGWLGARICAGGRRPHYKCVHQPCRDAVVRRVD